MKWFNNSAFIVAASCNGNPVLSTILVGLFYLAFNSVQAILEELIVGASFLNWVDPFIALIFIGYAGFCVWKCAIYNSGK